MKKVINFEEMKKKRNSQNVDLVKESVIINEILKKEDVIEMVESKDSTEVAEGKVNFVMLNECGCRLDNNTIPEYRQVVVYEKKECATKFTNSKKKLGFKMQPKHKYAIAGLCALMVIGTNTISKESFSESPLGRSLTAFADTSKGQSDEDFLNSVVNEEVINPYNTFKITKSFDYEGNIFDYIINVALYENGWSLKEENSSIIISIEKSKMGIEIGSVYPSEESLNKSSKDRKALDNIAVDIVRPMLIEKGISMETIIKILEDNMKSLDVFKDVTLPIKIELVDKGVK